MACWCMKIQMPALQGLQSVYGIHSPRQSRVISTACAHYMDRGAYLLVVIGERPPQDDSWLLVGVPDDDMEAVAIDVQLCEKILAVHEQRVVQGAHSAALKAEHSHRCSVHPQIVRNLPRRHCPYHHADVCLLSGRPEGLGRKGQAQGRSGSHAPLTCQRITLGCQIWQLHKHCVMFVGSVLCMCLHVAAEASPPLLGSACAFTGRHQKYGMQLWHFSHK